MKTSMFSVFDVKAAAYGTPFFMPREEMAIRAFADGVNEVGNPNNQWAKHPEDFTLFFIGTFDDELAVIDSLHPRPLVSAAGVKSIVGSHPVPYVNGKVLEEVV